MSSLCSSSSSSRGERLGPCQVWRVNVALTMSLAFWIDEYVKATNITIELSVLTVKAQCFSWVDTFQIIESFWFISKALKVGLWHFCQIFIAFIVEEIFISSYSTIYFWWTPGVRFLIFYLRFWHLHFWWRLIITWFSFGNVLSAFP